MVQGSRRFLYDLYTMYAMQQKSFEMPYMTPESTRLAVDWNDLKQPLDLSASHSLTSCPVAQHQKATIGRMATVDDASAIYSGPVLSLNGHTIDLRTPFS